MKRISRRERRKETSQKDSRGEVLKKDELLGRLAEAHAEQTLITGKHDPDQLDNYNFASEKNRTVVSHQMLPELADALKNGMFDVEAGVDCNSGSIVYCLKPTNPSLSVAGSGLAPFTNVPDRVCDSLVAVYGKVQGFHVFSEDMSALKKDKKFKNWKKLR